MKKFVVLIVLVGLTHWSCVKDEDAPAIIPPSPGNDGGTALKEAYPSYSNIFSTTKFTI